MMITAIEKWDYGAHRLSCQGEESEQSEDDEHVGEIYLVVRWPGEERFLPYADRHLRASEGEKKRRRSASVEMTGSRLWCEDMSLLRGRECGQI